MVETHSLKSIPSRKTFSFYESSLLSGSFLIKFSSLSAPTKIEELTARSDKKKTQPLGSIPGGAALCFFMCVFVWPGCQFFHICRSRKRREFDVSFSFLAFFHKVWKKTAQSFFCLVEKRFNKIPVLILWPLSTMVSSEDTHFILSINRTYYTCVFFFFWPRRKISRGDSSITFAMTTALTSVQSFFFFKFLYYHVKTRSDLNLEILIIILPFFLC